MEVYFTALCTFERKRRIWPACGAAESGFASGNTSGTFDSPDLISAIGTEITSPITATLNFICNDTDVCGREPESRDTSLLSVSKPDAVTRME